jgi:folate-binding protein YgfZ
MNFESHGMSAATPLRELHQKAGAKFAQFFGCDLPEVFSSPEQDYRAARETVALVDTNFRAAFQMTGPDRVRFLNAIATNDVQSLAKGQGSVGLLLNPQGHILAEIETYALADRFLLLTHAGSRERVAQWLDKYIIMDDVTLEDATDRMGSLALEGPRTAALLKEVCGLDLKAMQAMAHVEIPLNGVSLRAIRRSYFGGAGAELLAERDALPALWQTLLDAVKCSGGTPAGYAALNALRLEAGIPWFGYDFDEKVIPHEAALENTHISFTKGCYTGQEIVERVRSRGHVNRIRVSLEFSGTTAPAAGAKLTAGGKDAGHVTSAAFSPGRRRAIGMGSLRREFASPGSEVLYEDGSARVAK